MKISKLSCLRKLSNVNFDTSNLEVESIKLYTTNKMSDMRESVITELDSPIIMHPQSVVIVVYKLK